MTSKFTCPRCSHPLQIKHELTPAPERRVKVIVWCGNVRACPSEEAANDGGSGPTEEAAYRALLLSVKAEEDKETERECEPLSPEDLRDKNEWAKAEHANDMQKGGGV